MTTVDHIVYSSTLDFELTDEHNASVDDFGIDTLTRTYAGQVNLLPGFLAEIEAEFPDPIFNGLSSVGKPSIAIGKAFAKVVVQFRGKMSGFAGRVKSEDTWSENTIQCLAEVKIDGVVQTVAAVFVDYRGLKTSYDYTLPARPAKPRYNTPNRNPDDGIEIIAIRGLQGLGDLTDVANMSFGKLSVAAYARLAEWKPRQVGSWWEVHEEWEWALRETRGIQSGVVLIPTS